MANKKKDNPLVRVTVSLDPDDYRAFEALAEREDRSIAYTIRRAMAEYLQSSSEAEGGSAEHASA